jgi:hypothetical protein
MALAVRLLASGSVRLRSRTTSSDDPVEDVERFDPVGSGAVGSPSAHAATTHAAVRLKTHR